MGEIEILLEEVIESKYHHSTIPLKQLNQLRIINGCQDHNVRHLVEEQDTQKSSNVERSTGCHLTQMIKVNASL